MAGLNPTKLRREIVEMAWAGSSVHIACAFSMVEITAALLGEVMHLGRGADDPDEIAFCCQKATV